MAKGTSTTVRGNPCASVTMRRRERSPLRSAKVACVPSGPTLSPGQRSQSPGTSYSGRERPPTLEIYNPLPAK